MDNKDLIKQYVDTGLGIPEYQFNQLSNNDKKTYIRKRVIAIGHTMKLLTNYEFNFLDDSSKLEYVKNRIKKDVFLSPHEWDFIPNNIKLEFLYNKIQKNNGILYDYEWDFAPDNIKIECIKIFFNSHQYSLPVHQFNWVMSQNNTDLINQYINLTKHLSIPNYQEHTIRDYQFSTGSNKDKLIYIKSEIEDRDNILADVKFEWLLKQNNPELIIEYIKKFNGLPEKQLKKLPNWAIEKYLDNRLIYKEHLGGKLYDYELKYFSNSQKIKYKELLTNG